jgi:CBS domain-containing protein
MKVSEIMRSPAPAVGPDAKVKEAARKMLEENVSGLAVVDDSNHIHGLVTDKDLVEKHMRVHFPVYLGILGGVLPWETRRTEEELRHVLGTTASDLMSEKPVRISPDADVDDAATVMVDHNADQLLVVNGERLVGMLTRNDIIRLLLTEESDDAQSNPA